MGTQSPADQPAVEAITATPDARTDADRFLDLARKLAAVPKSELDAELEAVKAGKPLKPIRPATR